MAATNALLRGGNPESHIHDAVQAVAREAPEYYDEHTIRDVLGEAALHALLERVDHGEARDQPYY